MLNFNLDSADQDIAVQSCQSAHFQSPIIGKTQKPPPYMFNFSLDSAGQDTSVQSYQAAHFQSPNIGKTQKPPPYLFNFSLDSAGQDIAVQSCQSAHFQSPIIGKSQKPLSYMFNFFYSAPGHVCLELPRGAFSNSPLWKNSEATSLQGTFLYTRLARTFLFRAAKRCIFKVPPLEKLRSHLLIC